MKHTRFLTILMVALLPLVVLPASAQEAVGPDPVGLRPDAPTYALHGPYWVGIQDYAITFNYPDGMTRESRVTIWYPAQQPADVSATFTYPAEQRVEDYGGPFYFPRPGQAYLDAAPAVEGAPYPLVIYSHGGWGYRWFQPEYVEHLASHGFVVLSTDHEDAPPFGPMLPHFELSRQWDITRLIDYAVQITAEGGVLAGVINTEQIGVTGYSAGGFTALLAGGARISPMAKVAWCESEETQNSWIWPLLCTELDARGQSWSELLGWSDVPSDLWPQIGDPRVDTIVSIDGGAHDFGQQGIDAISIPALLIFARGAPSAIPYDHDSLLQAVHWDQQAVAVFEYANHGIFHPECLASMITAETFDLCAEPVWDIPRAHDLTNHLATAFLLDVFYSDTEAHAALLAENVNFPGITYETTLK